MELFGETELSRILGFAIAKLREEIESKDRNYLLNVNETEFTQHLVDKYRVPLLEIHDDKVSVSDYDRQIDGRHVRDFGYLVRPGQTITRQVVRYHIPFSGNASFLGAMPSRRLVWSHRVEVQNSTILLDIISWEDDAGRIERDYSEFLKNLKIQVDHCNHDLRLFNDSLEREVQTHLQGRKAELLKKANLLGSLNVPVRQAQNVPTTFTVPPPQRRQILLEPKASSAPFTPDPTLDPTTYREIQRIIHDTGMQMERLPAVYSDKDEETLRDHLIMVLSPHFQSTTGETFNKQGKTDILIRHERHNLFVAECGVWRGAKWLGEKIDQLLSYLTWRDSKTALVVFIRTKELSGVLETIRAEVPKHASFVKAEAPDNDAWMHYEMALPTDRGRAVRMAVLCFHFPEGDEPEKKEEKPKGAKKKAVPK